MKLPALAAACILATSSAQAINIVKLSADHVDYYYDADFWDLDVEVLDNTLYLNTSQAHQEVQVTGASGELDFSIPHHSVLAVAQDGYVLTQNIGGGYGTGMQADGVSGHTGYNYLLTLSSGSYSGGTFTPTEIIGSLDHTQVRYFAPGYEFWIPPVGGYEFTSTATTYSAIWVDGLFHGFGSMEGAGTLGVGLYSMNYKFDVSPVPEPDTYLMLGAGIALLGVAARRRQRKR